MTRSNDCMSMGLITLVCFACTDGLRAGYEEVELESSGTIVGVVTFAGDVPRPESLQVKSEEQVCLHNPIWSETLVVSQDKTIQWSVVSIKRIQRGKPFSRTDPEKPVQLDQVGCRFVPHVVLVRKGRKLRILNSDGILHNVHTKPRKNASFNRGMPGDLKTMEVSFKRAEKFPVVCDIHEWMGAWVGVIEHPYHAVTGSDGVFRFTKVPVGSHTIQVWHETLGKQEKQVTVRAGAEARVDFTFQR